MWAGWGALYKGGVCSVLSGAEGVLWGMGDFLLRGGGGTHRGLGCLMEGWLWERGFRGWGACSWGNW